VKTAPRVTAEAESHRGFTFTEVKLNFDFDATVAALPEPLRESTLETLKKANVEKGLRWIGTDGKTLLTITAKDWATARAALDAYLDGKSAVGADTQFQVTRGQLPTDANLILIAETATAVESAVEAARTAGEALPGGLHVGNVKKVKGAPTYLGLSLTLKNETVTLSAFVPNSAIAVARKMLDSIFQMAD
jgi:hypothetical protein